MILTDAEIGAIVEKCDPTGRYLPYVTDTHDFARAIEAAVMEKMELVGYFAAEYMGGPVIYYQVNLSEKDAHGIEPLYRLKEVK